MKAIRSCKPRGPESVFTGTWDEAVLVGGEAV